MEEHLRGKKTIYLSKSTFNPNPKPINLSKCSYQKTRIEINLSNVVYQIEPIKIAYQNQPIKREIVDCEYRYTQANSHDSFLFLSVLPDGRMDMPVRTG